jgi:hypothetical protein
MSSTLYKDTGYIIEYVNEHTNSTPNIPPPTPNKASGSGTAIPSPFGTKPFFYTSSGILSQGPQYASDTASFTTSGQGVPKPGNNSGPKPPGPDRNDIILIDLADIDNVTSMNCGGATVIITGGESPTTVLPGPT